MKVVKSFSISKELADLIDTLPKTERSRIIEQILWVGLKGLKKNSDMEEIKDMLNRIIIILSSRQTAPPPPPTAGAEPKLETKAVASLNSILKMRK